MGQREVTMFNMRGFAWSLIGAMIAVGSGLGNASAQEQPALSATLENGTVLVPKDQMVLLISDDKRMVTGYAEGFQVPHPLKKLEGVEPVPIVGPRTVGAVRNGNYVLAFSGLLGKWDELELAPSQDVTLTFGDESIVVQDKNGLSYHFRANWGKWFTHEEILRGDVKEHLAKNGLMNEVQPTRQVHLNLTYLDAAKIRDLLQKKYEAEIAARRLPSLGAVTLGGQNLLIVGGDEILVNEIESWVNNLDKESVSFATGIRLDPQKSKQDGSRGIDFNGRNPIGESGFPRVRRNRQGDRTKDLAELKKQLSSEEAQAFELAKELRGVEPNTNLSQMLALRVSVMRAFRLKQQIRQIEIDELKNKLNTLESELTQRSGNELEIVSRRMSQLVDPKFNWEDETAEKKQLQDAIAEKNSADDRRQGMWDMLSEVNQGRGMGFNRGGASGLSRAFRQEDAAPQSSNTAATSSDGSESKAEDVLVVIIKMPNSFRVVDGDFSKRSTSHFQYVYVRHTGKFTVRLDRIAGLHEWEVVLDVELLPGKKVSPNSHLVVDLSQYLKRLMTEEMSGIISRDGIAMSVKFGDKNFANDPLNPLNFSDSAIGVVRLRAEKRAGDVIKNETEILGKWYRSASRSIEGAPVQIGNATADAKNADFLSLTVGNGKWESTFRGNTTLFAAKYDFETLPQRVTLTKLNADGTETDTVYERLIEIRNGDLYTAVKPKDANGEGLASFDDTKCIIETYVRELEANEDLPEEN